MALYWRYSHTGMSYWGNSIVILNILECHSDNIVIVNILHCWRYWLPYWNYCHIERTGMSCWTHCHVEDNVMWKNTVMLKLQLCWRYRILKFFYIEGTVLFENTVMLKTLAYWNYCPTEDTSTESCIVHLTCKRCLSGSNCLWEPFTLMMYIVIAFNKVNVYAVYVCKYSLLSIELWSVIGDS